MSGVVNCCVPQHFPIPHLFDPRRTFICCVLTTIEAAEATYMPSERAKRRIRPKAEFIVPAGDIIWGIDKALQSQRRFDKHCYGRPVSTVTAATGKVKESRAVAEEVPKAVGRTRFTSQKW